MFWILFSLLALYFIFAFVLAYLPVNSGFAECKTNGVEIYMKTNGVHTDIIVPIEHELKNWRKYIHPEATKGGDRGFRYVAFGWGDKGFYLQTPEWSDLKFSTAFKAVFFLSTTAMHVTFYKELEENTKQRTPCNAKPPV